METEFKRVAVSQDMRRLLAFDRKVFPQSDLFFAREWKEYEPYWMIIDGTRVGCCAFQAHVDFQEDIREDGVNPLMQGSLYISTTGILQKYRGVRTPMMSISHSDLMPIRSERSDAGLSQFEALIDIRQEFCLPSLS